MAFVAMAIVCAAFGRQIAPYPPNQQDLLLGDSPPSAEHWAGTDLLGRDVLSRTIVGARTALVGPAVVAAGAFAIATILGLWGGYVGGATDSLVMRWVDFMFALPGPLIAIVIVGVVGGGFWTAVAVLVVLFTAPDTRIVRSAVLEQRPLPYIEAARTLGIPRRRIMFRHIFPNILPLIAAYVVLDFAFALVSLAALSFLGLGVPPGHPRLGADAVREPHDPAHEPDGRSAPGGRDRRDGGQHQHHRGLDVRADVRAVTEDGALLEVAGLRIWSAIGSPASNDHGRNGPARRGGGDGRDRRRIRFRQVTHRASDRPTAPRRVCSPRAASDTGDAN